MPRKGIIWSKTQRAEWSPLKLEEREAAFYIPCAEMTNMLQVIRETRED